MPAPTEIVAGLPQLPGVYRMVGETGEVLYVGKAGNLRKRVASYFQKRGGLAPRTEVMLSRVASVEVTVTRSEGEALLLESNLIKTLSPRYNVLFRDDKSYPYLVVSAHDFPRLGFHRGGLDKRNRYFGPFPNAGAVRESIQLLQKVFRLRTCEDTVYANRSRPCLLHQIKRCTAPCVGLVAVSDYAEDVRSAELFLKGRDDEVLERLIARMNAAAQALRYEEAALYRDQIAALRKVREKQFVSGESGADTDIIACARTAGVTCVNLVMVRGGRHLGDKNFYPSNAEGSTEQEVIEAFLAQHYARHGVPMQLVVGAAIDAHAFETVLGEQAGRKVQIIVQPVGTRRAWLEMANKNAQLGAAQTLGLQATQESRLSALQQVLGMPETSHRIECFDISHTMGEATVAACVVYDRATMQNSEYRRYNIEDVAPGDDYEAMRQVLTRRYRRVVAGEGRMPDLVLIDGGKGQLAVARQVSTELGLNDVMLVAVAKGEERKPGQEQLLITGRDTPLILGRDSSALHLIQQIRDEAHRFAIEGHRARRGKARTRSPLEEIVGIGTKRRQRLLTRFGGLKGLMAASVDDMAQVEGISRSLAEKIHRELH
ncbi:MAG TPA: excinuclease ABC subunit UvrC [Burkholderiales bacterium]|nr:excinuclease ABC subunit UvrC [Burkholderiales bacterium]